MKAALLLQLEPFAEITEATLTQFLHTRYGGTWQVRWVEGGGRGAGQRWLCNVHINAIFRPQARHEALEVVRREFARSVSPWKRPLQRAYFALATTPPVSSLLARATLEIEPAVPGAEDLVMVTGTHKLRIVDARRQRVYCCRRSTTPAEHFRHEVAAREQAQQAGVRVPRILEHLSDDCLVEELALGTPQNRLASVEERESALRQAMRELHKLYAATRGSATAAGHAAMLREDIARSLAAGGSVAQRDAAEFRRLMDAFAQGLGEEEVLTVQAHVDFQPGNLLWDGAGVWLIDWEYSARRQHLYDRLAWAVRSRFPAGLAERAAAFLRDPASVLCEPLQPGPEERFDPATTLRLFLLEELVIHARENADPQWRAPTPKWLEFRAEAAGLLRLLEQKP